YKREGHKKIETRRLEGRPGGSLAQNDPGIVAIASDFPVTDEQIPVFDLDNTTGLADFIEHEMGLAR
ncbi:hypothetical protein LXJ58_30610, partial [Escherichia coli]|nr:hypothetical protein [Escherichia coli]